jgi:hypothetical protein
MSATFYECLGADAVESAAAERVKIVARKCGTETQRTVPRLSLVMNLNQLLCKALCSEAEYRQ